MTEKSKVSIAEALGSRAHAIKSLERAQAAFDAARNKVKESKERFERLDKKVKQLQAAEKKKKIK